MDLQCFKDDKQFMTSVVNATSPEALSNVLAEKGFELKEGITIDDAYMTLRKSSETELDETSLDDVSGGTIISSVAMNTLKIMASFLKKKSSSGTNHGGSGHHF